MKQRLIAAIRRRLVGLLKKLVSRLEAPNVRRSVPAGEKDEFLQWVGFAVPGWLPQSNLDAIEYSIRNMPKNSAVVEIGSFCGLSTVLTSYLLQKYGHTGSFFTCDKWVFEGQRAGQPLGHSPTVTHDVYKHFVKARFLETLRAFVPDRLPSTIECFSDEFFQLWKAGAVKEDVFGSQVAMGGQIGFCYIDGNHTYDFAVRDFENAASILLPGGFVLLDDSGDNSGWEVNRLAREICRRPEFELVAQDPNYLFRKLR